MPHTNLGKIWKSCRYTAKLELKQFGDSWQALAYAGTMTPAGTAWLLEIRHFKKQIQKTGCERIIAYPEIE